MEASKMLTLAGNPIHVVPDGPKAVDTFIESFARQRSLAGDESAFYVINLGDVIEKYRQWVKLLPKVTPFYAVKCNNDPVLLSVLALLGAGFDCASQQEIQQALEQLETPVDPSRIVYAHPIKQKSYIRYAKEKGVELMVFDSAEELVKIKAHYPEARLLVRINPRHSENTSESGEMVSKFGCSVPEAVRLLAVAEQLDLHVVGVSFYVGHRLFVSSVYEECISQSRSVFDAAAKSFPRFRFEVLDIGGGFYGEWKTARLPFADAASAISSALDRNFGDLIAAGKIQVIAEPGGYMAMTSSTSVANVVGVRRVPSNFHEEIDGERDRANDSTTTNGNRESRDDNDDASLREKSNEECYHYYINDGIFGSMRAYEFYSKQKGEQDAGPYRIAARQSEISSEESRSKTYKSIVWGPTCDGLDCVIEQCRLERIEVGDWLAFKDVGQYTFTLVSGFNGMPPPIGYYVIEQRYVKDLGRFV